MARKVIFVILSAITFILLFTACSFSETTGCPNENKSGINTFGNTSGNQANGGLVAVQGEWVYFLLKDFPYEYSNLICKRNIDETEETYWRTNADFNLNVVGNWIYYYDINSFRMCKEQTNGDGNYEEISNIDLGIDSQVVGDWIYYNSENRDGFYKIRTDGKRKKRIMKKDSCYLFYVDSKKIFFTSHFMSADSQGLYSVDINGKGKTLLVPANIGDIACLNVDEDWVYYINFSSIPDNKNLGVWKVRKDGTEKTKITEDIGTINVADGWVYYANSNDNNSLYKIRTDGTEKTKLHSDTTDQINIAGEWIYYPIMKSDGLRGDLYRIRTDGTDRQRVTLGSFIPEEPTAYNIYTQEQTTIPELPVSLPY